MHITICAYEPRGRNLMNKQVGISSLLATAASLLVVGFVAVGSASPAAAWSEEALPAPHGSYVSSLAVPADHAVYYAGDNRPVVVIASEEDAAVPPGAFTTAMTEPAFGGDDIQVANNAHLADVNLSEIVALGLE